jgi:hypothetical protein
MRRRDGGCLPVVPPEHLAQTSCHGQRKQGRIGSGFGPQTTAPGAGPGTHDLADEAQRAESEHRRVRNAHTNAHTGLKSSQPDTTQVVPGLEVAPPGIEPGLF